MRTAVSMACVSTPSPRLAGRPVAALIFAFFLAACSGQAPPTLSASGIAMGTTWSVQVVSPPAGLTERGLRAQVQEALDAVDARMSTHRPDSELSRINARATTEWIPISEPLYRVLETAQAVSRLTAGAFDVTVAPLVDLWGFGPTGTPHVPAPEALRAALQRVGYEKLELRADPPALRKRVPTLHIDLSGIAKGLAVDRAAEVLEALGITNYLVEAGGELRGRGHNAQGVPWQIAIERPEPGARVPYALFALRDRASATSGDYRNYFERDGRRYSHAIDPSTGRPVAQDLASVTVLDAHCMRADALATGLFVLGPERGYRLARDRGIPAYFIMAGKNGLRHRAAPAFRPHLLVDP